MCCACLNVFSQPERHRMCRDEQGLGSRLEPEHRFFAGRLGNKMETE